LEKTKIIFGTDGWRGLVGDELNNVNIQRVAQAFALYIKENGTQNRVAIGFDGRKFSKEFAHIFAEVLSGNKIEVLVSDRILPTPVVSYVCLTKKCDAGVMITASHNPPQYNGIKFKSSDGSPFFTEQTAIIESFIDRNEAVKSTEKIAEIDFTKDYISHIEKLIDFETIMNAGLNVAIDSMAGAGGLMLENLLKKHNIKVQTIFGNPETDFCGRLAEPVAANLQPLSDFLKGGNFSLGLATDGDADRLGVMTDRGEFMNIQETILYLAQYIKLQRNVDGPLVKTASVTDKVLSFSKSTAVEVIDVQVGFKYVAEAMMESGAAFGAEESGGFGFKGHLPERDGIFSALVFLEMLSASGFKSLDAFIRNKRLELGEIFYSRIDCINDNPKRHNVLAALTANPPKTLSGFNVTEIKTYLNSRGLINGQKIRLEGNPRWLLIRVSETEPMVRIYAEAENDTEVKTLLESGYELFSAYLQK
jgi:phosphomannomutase